MVDLHEYSNEPSGFIKDFSRKTLHYGLHIVQTVVKYSTETWTCSDKRKKKNRNGRNENLRTLCWIYVISEKKKSA
jgi:hypothetical protein